MEPGILYIIFFIIHDFLLHNAYLANITTTKEPHTYAQVILDPNWQKAMDEELSTNMDLDTVTR